jgi:hypothetical protein
MERLAVAHKAAGSKVGRGATVTLLLPEGRTQPRGSTGP